MKQNSYTAFEFNDGKFLFLNQVKLPAEEEYIETDDYNRIAEAIERLEIRGAPAIGITAAYALALSVKNSNQAEDSFRKAAARLEKTRPTAVNLFHCIEVMKEMFNQNKDSADIFKILLAKAGEIHQQDIEYCRKIGENGLAVFKKKSSILTHCNTGKLATGGEGTAFNVIKTGFEKGLVNFVYADETRPLLQGLRLTAFELEKNGIPFAVQSDSSAAMLMKENKIDFVIVGADRIALNGDTANKIGTYNLAVIAFHHNIPFYVAAPTTTIDRQISTGEDIIIEHRSKNELLRLNGVPVAPENYDTFSPAFDVTPSHLITGIITEEKVYFFPYNFLQPY